MLKREWEVWVARRWISISTRGCSHTSCPIMLLAPVFWTEFPFPNFRGLTEVVKSTYQCYALLIQTLTDSSQTLVVSFYQQTRHRVQAPPPR